MKKVVQKESSDILDAAQRKVEPIIAEATKKAEQIIREAQLKADKEATRINVKAKQRADKIIVNARRVADRESEKFRAVAEKETEKLIKNSKEKAMAEVDENRLFRGMVKLKVIPPTDRGHLVKLKESLAKVEGIRSIGDFLSSDNQNRINESRIYIQIKQPTPLLYILKEMPIIESAITEGGYIKVSLNKESNNG